MDNCWDKGEDSTGHSFSQYARDWDEIEVRGSADYQYCRDILSL